MLCARFNVSIALGFTFWAASLIALVPASRLPAQEQEQVPEPEKVVEVRVSGNRTVPTAKVLGQLQTRAGRPFDAELVERDVKRLATQGWFLDVKPFSEQVPGGRIVVFQVVERPTLRYVNYLGNESIRDKHLAGETGLKVGDAVDPYAVEEGRRKIEQFYKDRGYNRVQVTVLEGSRVSDQGAVFVINEGQQQKILNVDFIGNSIASDSRLKTQIQSKPGILWIFKGYVDRKKIDEDVDRLTAYYRSLGFFRARVSREIEFGESGNWATITFVIDEGPRYKVRKVSFLGSNRFDSELLAQELKLKAGDFFDQSAMNTDVGTLRDAYGSEGYVFADVQASPRTLEGQPELDLVYEVDEGQRYRVGRITVHIKGENPHTRRQTVLNRVTLQTGDIVDIRELRASERRLRASGLFENNPQTGTAPRIVFSPPGEESATAKRRRRTGFRGQSPDPVRSWPAPTPQLPPNDRLIDLNVYGMALPSPRPREATRVSHQLQNAPESASVTHSSTYLSRLPANQRVVRAQSPSSNPWSGYQPQPRPDVGGWQTGNLEPGGTSHATGQFVSGQNTAANSQSSVILPQGQGTPTSTLYSTRQPVAGQGNLPNPGAGGGTSATLGDVTPLFADPNGEEVTPLGVIPESLPYIHPEIYVDETQTGRFMVGVGVNSDLGVIGSITIDEQNFDWRRWPTSWQDFRNGTAFRGGGQRFRVEALPGNEVQRYLVSFQEPYFLDTAISLGLSGFFFDRRYREWDEQRLGGRVSLGYQLTPDLASTFSYRGEKVNIHNPAVPTPPELAEVVGDNGLHGFKLALTHDTRDSAFLATEGHYIEIGGEQVIGTFDYPRVTIDARQYFLVRQRPDGSGRHVISVSGQAGYTGSQTPIYDHFFIGGFSTLRGFEFRGASPRAPGGVTIGGEFMLIGSVEYLLPITASDTLRAVAFCDFGTAEPKVEINKFRVSPGVGLRILVPAMGPAPIALDFAFPVVKDDRDLTQVFSFNIGFLR